VESNYHFFFECQRYIDSNLLLLFVQQLSKSYLMETQTLVMMQTEDCLKPFIHNSEKAGDSLKHIHISSNHQILPIQIVELSE
jgi:archaellum biogenesis ATPase FlaH